MERSRTLVLDEAGFCIAEGMESLKQDWNAYGLFEVILTSYGL